MKPLLIHSEAELELWQAVEYYEEKRAGLGIDFEREARRAFADIQAAPVRQPITKSGARRRLLHRFPYAIYYLELQDIIWITAVAHTSRKPFYWLNRSKTPPA